MSNKKLAIREFATFGTNYLVFLRHSLSVFRRDIYLTCLTRQIPWMIGPMIAVAAVNLTSVRMHSPPYARQLGRVILGSAVSLYLYATCRRRASG